MNKYAIYTVLTGGYDNVLQPQVLDKNFDYILFTDAIIEQNIGVWQVRSIPYVNSDRTRLSRYPKMLPHRLMSEYDAWLYLDANVQITNHRIYDCFIDLVNKNIDWGYIQHPYRDCIYDEAYVALACGLDTEDAIFTLCHYLRQENYPRHNGLFENNVIYRRNNGNVAKVNEHWWSMYEHYSRRDQLTLQYVLWKAGNIETDYLLPLGESSWNSDTLQITRHSRKARGTRGIKQSFLEHARGRCRTGMEEKENQFREFHYWLYGLKPQMAKFMLAIWGVYSLFVYGAIIKYRAYKKHKYGA